MPQVILLLNVTAMDNIDKVLSTSLDRYFVTLSQFGYKEYCSVTKLLVLSYIEEMLYNETWSPVPEKDYRDMDKALYCLYGNSCLIPYPEYINNDSLFKKTAGTCPGKTEDSVPGSALQNIPGAATE